jgi:putative ATPase
LFSVDLQEPLDAAGLSALLHRRVAVYDKDREGHYNLISALHKSIRGSDPQASLYYMARMLVAGEEPLYLLRRLTRAAVEDIGSRTAGARSMHRGEGYVRFLAARRRARDRAGVPLPRDGAQIERRLRRAEGGVAVGQGDGVADAPKNILNAPTKLMKQVGYGRGYSYDHDAPEGFSGDNYWPEEMEPQAFYAPSDRGYEKRIAERLAWWEERRAEQGK